MPDCMTFPDTVEEFMEQYKVVDTERVYTNGTEFVPIYRMRQWFQHEPETHEKRTETHECDLISRNDAIRIVDSIDTWQAGWRGNAIESLKAMPSAQPEIIRCKDCKHGAPNGRYGCRVYHYKRYETHDMKPDDFCSLAERRTDEAR